MAQKQQISTGVFFSYVQTDQKWYEQLAKHLSQLKRDGLIEEWSYQQILPGTDRTKEIDQALHSARIILLFISADFLASDYCYNIEMQQALQRHQRGEARVIPIIIRPCVWEDSPFAHLQCLPRNAKPITTWSNRDDAFVSIVQELRKLLAQQQSPHKPLSNLQRQNRTRLLKRVRTTWIEGLLEHSLHQAAWIDLHLQDQPDMLENPWRLQVQELNQEPHALPVDTSIVQVYDEAEGELLILGEPGAGKTTLLLHLAQTLLDRAETDEQLPIPVVFHLSSIRQHEPFAKWLGEELRTKYQVPRRMAEQWFDAHQILPLLDGLDEVAEEARVSCVQAITTYCSSNMNQIGTPLVVCCRSQEYQKLSLHMPLSRVVSILPLTEHQIDEYLSNTQGLLQGLRQALENDAELAALAHRPLMLSIFALAYQGEAIKNFETSSSSQEQILQSVFSSYVKRMLSRRGPLPPWMHKHFLRWLTFIAKQLHENQQTILQLENLQPYWLPPKLERLYQLSVGQFIGETNAERTTLIWSWKNARWWLSFGLSFGLLGAFFDGLLPGLLDGLLGALLGVLFPGLSEQWLSEQPHLSPNEGIWRSMKSGLLFGLIFGLPFGLHYGLHSDLSTGLSAGLTCVLFGGLPFGLGAFIQHFIVRIFLWRTNSLPWRLIPFLDEAVERLLLRKVGGSYIFIHRLLLEYFATLDDPLHSRSKDSLDKIKTHDIDIE